VKCIIVLHIAIWHAVCNCFIERFCIISRYIGALCITSALMCLGVLYAVVSVRQSDQSSSRVLPLGSFQQHHSVPVWWSVFLLRLTISVSLSYFITMSTVICTQVSRYQKGKTRKGKTNLDLLELEIGIGSGICWAICKSAPHPRQPRQHPTTQFFTGLMSFLPPNQQRQSTEGNSHHPQRFVLGTHLSWSCFEMVAIQTKTNCVCCQTEVSQKQQHHHLRPVVWNYPGELVPEEILIHSHLSRKRWHCHWKLSQESEWKTLPTCFMQCHRDK